MVLTPKSFFQLVWLLTNPCLGRLNTFFCYCHFVVVMNLRGPENGIVYIPLSFPVLRTSPGPLLQCSLNLGGDGKNVLTKEKKFNHDLFSEPVCLRLLCSSLVRKASLIKAKNVELICEYRHIHLEHVLTLYQLI